MACQTPECHTGILRVPGNGTPDYRTRTPWKEQIIMRLLLAGVTHLSGSALSNIGMILEAERQVMSMLRGAVEQQRNLLVTSHK
jgi:hypothetical protein